MGPKRLTAIALAVLSIIFPVAVYFGVRIFSPVFFALLLLFAAVARYCLGAKREGAQTALLVIAAGYSVVLALSGSEFVLKLYPAVMSVCIGALFFISTFQSQSLIERLVLLRGGKVTAIAKSYIRRLTFLWAMLLFFNAGIAAYLAAFGSLENWALYTGVVSYAVFALFAALEYIYRLYYIHKYENPATSA